MSKNLIVSILVLILIVGAGFWFASKGDISKEVPPPVQTDDGQVLGVDSALKIGESVTFSDGLKVTLKEINDSRCKEGVVCVWQGELSSLIDVSGGKIKTPAELVLGTENFKTQHMDGYTFTLKSATENSITLEVIYEEPVFTSGGCFVGGCSGQLCTDDQDVMSTCEYKEQYACYKTARCERQANGQCGWTPTEALQACLGK